MAPLSAERSYIPDEPRLRSLFDAGRRQAARQGRSILASAVVRLPAGDPLTFYERGAGVSGGRFYWSSENARSTMVGIGAAWTLAVAGPHRFADAAAAWRARCDGALVDAEIDVTGTGPVLMGGFSFDPLRPATARWKDYPGGLLTLPRYVRTSVDRETWLTVNAVLSPDSAADADVDAIRDLGALLAGQPADAAPEPAPETFGVDVARLPLEWKDLVRSMVERIKNGQAEKVVLAQSCQARGRSRFIPSRILRRLQADYPSCFLFAVDRGDQCFLGASPELLARLDQDSVQTMCLAGSTARGATAEEDQRLATELLASAKNRAEHAIVVRGIRDLLAGAGVSLEPAGTPTLLKVRNIQHLYTPIVGRAATGQTILDLVRCLHPTPSVGGYPRAAALQLIRDHEGLDRGWYAGPVGWIGAQGQGEFTVGIRSALLRGAEATVFAGCGIVADSDPEQEYAEARLKLRPILSALRGTDRDD